MSEKNLKWATFIFVQTNLSQQTLICLLGQFDKRFSQRSSTILALAHDALAERQGLPYSKYGRDEGETKPALIAEVLALLLTEE